MDFSAIFAAGAFILAFIFIASEKMSKAVIVLAGASLFMVSKIISQDKAFHEVDWNVIFLLIGMMIVVGIVKQTGLFQYVAIKLAKAAKGNPYRILIYLSMTTAVFSALVDNVTTVLILVPITILIAVELGISPVPFVISQIVASNVGGTATLIGDPPNIMIGSAANLSFMDFVINLTPLIIILMAVYSVFAYFAWGKKMVVTNERKARIMEFKESGFIEDKPLLIKSLIVLALLIAGFIFHGALHLEAATIALAGASILMLISGQKEMTALFHEIEWETVFFFIGLFIMVGGLVETGIIKTMAGWLMSMTEGDVQQASYIILWASGVFSGIIDNIPFVATMIPLIQHFAEDPSIGTTAIMPVWWSLALGACLGGNATLIGASANVVSAGISAKSGYRITFWEFTKYGMVITFINLVISHIYIYLRYF